MGLVHSYYTYPPLLLKQFWLEYPQSPPRQLHPALVALVRAIAAFRRAGCEEDAQAWRAWIVAVFQKQDWERAFAMEFELPKRVSEAEDVKHGEQWLKLAGKELARFGVLCSEREGGGDRGAHGLFVDEVWEYEERKHRDVRDATYGDEDGGDMVRSFVGVENSSGGRKDREKRK